MRISNQVDGVVQGRQHSQPEQVELHQPDCCAVVLVPLQHRAVCLGGPFGGADMGHRPVADDHAARVDAEMARRPFERSGQLCHVGGNASLIVLWLVGAVACRLRPGVAPVACTGPACPMGLGRQLVRCTVRGGQRAVPVQ